MPKILLLILSALILFTACSEKTPLKREPYTPVYPNVEPYVWGSGEYTLQTYNQKIHL